MVEEVRTVHKGRVLTLNLERVRLPNGRLAELEIAHHPGGSAVVAIDAAQRVCLLRQFRHAILTSATLNPPDAFATACGLGIAIVALIPLNLFNRKVARLQYELETAATNVEVMVNALKTK